MFRKRFFSFKTENIESKYPNFVFILWRHLSGDNVPFPLKYCNDTEMYLEKLFQEFDTNSMGNEIETYGYTSKDLNKPFLKTILDEESYHITIEMIPLEVIAYNQKMLRKYFADGFITLYRGTTDTKKLNKFLSYVEENETIWTESLGVAKMFRGRGTIISSFVDVEDVLLSPYGSIMIETAQEHEFIVKRGGIDNIEVVS